MVKKRKISISILVVTILCAMFMPLGLASDAEITVVGVVTEDGYLELSDQKRIKVMDTEMAIIAGSCWQKD